MCSSDLNGRELVKLEGAEAIQELQRMSQFLQTVQPGLEPTSKGAISGEATLPR